MKVSKYNASGNDFVIFADNEKESFADKDKASLAKILCAEKSGIGADGLIYIKKHELYDFEWEFYNNDGSEAEMCGNGSRAAAMFAYEHSLAGKKMSFLTKAGVIKCEILDESQPYNFLVKSTLSKMEKKSEPFEEDGQKYFFYDSGVPHILSFVEDLTFFDLERARFLREKYNANVNIAKIEDGILKVRTYERGVEDETLACGTGMSACFFVANKEFQAPNIMELRPKSQEKVIFELKDGILTFQALVQHSFDAEFFL